MDLGAYELLLELLAHSHNYGESIADKIELWIGASFGLIVMAYFAPDRLTLGMATLVIAIYIAFTSWSVSNISADLELSQAAMQDAKVLAETYHIDSRSLGYRLSEGGGGSGVAVILFQVGLFLGTVGYVGFTARTTSRRKQEQRT